MPVDNFHIPALILGADITPRRDDRIASQIDLGPTLLSLIGIGDATPMTGRDLSDPGLGAPGRALMQYDGNFAWMQGEDVVVLQPRKPAQQYRYDPGSGRLRPRPLDPALAQLAHAQALWGSLAYEKQWYRAPGQGRRSGLAADEDGVLPGAATPLESLGVALNRPRSGRASPAGGKGSRGRTRSVPRPRRHSPEGQESSLARRRQARSGQ